MDKRIVTYWNTLPEELKPYNWINGGGGDVVADEVRSLLREMGVSEENLNDPYCVFSLYQKEDKSHYLRIGRNLPACYDYSDKPMD